MIDITALGELLIDFTPAGNSASGMKLYEQNPGGAPANVLTAMSKIGLKTAFVGKVGNDTHGLFLKETLEKEGIDTKGLVLDPYVYTTLAFVTLNEEGEREFSFARKPGADIMLTAEEIDISLVQESKVFHLGSLSLCSEPSRNATLYTLEKAREANCIISYDPNYRALLWDNREIACKHMQSILPYVDLIKMSEEETELITPYRSPEKAAKHLIDMGVSIAVITLGGKGAYVSTSLGSAIVSGFQSAVVDTTGAGDSFWGGFLSQLVLSNTNLKDITLDQVMNFAEYGNSVASLCVEKRGAIPAMPNKDEIEKRLYGMKKRDD